MDPLIQLLYSLLLSLLTFSIFKKKKFLITNTGESHGLVYSSIYWASSCSCVCNSLKKNHIWFFLERLKSLQSRNVNTFSSLHTQNREVSSEGISTELDSLKRTSEQSTGSGLCAHTHTEPWWNWGHCGTPRPWGHFNKLFEHKSLGSASRGSNLIPPFLSKNPSLEPTGSRERPMLQALRSGCYLSLAISRIFSVARHCSFLPPAIWSPDTIFCFPSIPQLYPWEVG